MEENKRSDILSGWFELESYLYSNKQISFEHRIAMAYGALNSARLAGAIDWGNLYNKFGKFVASIYNIEVFNK